MLSVSQMSAPKKYAYIDLSKVPEKSGVYAWYSSISIWESDLKEFEQRVSDKREDPAQVYAYVQERLDSLVFKKYREDDYQIILRGALKPRYEGEAKHVPPASDALIKRLIDDPKRLRTIAASISSAAPYFTAPLYIGMAQNLRERLLHHKQLIDSHGDG